MPRREALEKLNITAGRGSRSAYLMDGDLSGMFHHSVWTIKKCSALNFSKFLSLFPNA
jgi:hypothetical protein